MPQLRHFLGSTRMLGAKACTEEDNEVTHVFFSQVFSQALLLLSPHLTGDSVIGPLGLIEFRSSLPCVKPGLQFLVDFYPFS